MEVVRVGIFALSLMWGQTLSVSLKRDVCGRFSIDAFYYIEEILLYF